MTGTDWLQPTAWEQSLLNFWLSSWSTGPRTHPESKETWLPYQRSLLHWTSAYQWHKFLAQSLHLIHSCPVSIVKHIVTKYSTETTLCHHPSASVILSSSVTASTLLATMSTMIVPLPLPVILKDERRVYNANIMISLLWMFTCWWYYQSPVLKWSHSFHHISMILQTKLSGNTTM
jgi:hypothetical protein